MTESQFLTYVLSGAGLVLSVLLAIIGWLVVRGLDSFRDTIAGVRDDFNAKCDEITSELRIISQRVTDNSEAVSGRINDLSGRIVKLETYREQCAKYCSIESSRHGNFD